LSKHDSLRSVDRYRRICVPVDPTPLSERALPLAAAVALRAHSVVDLAHVVFSAALGTELYGAAVATEEIDTLKRAGRERLGQLARPLQRQGVHTAITILEGSIAKALADHVEATGVDLVVMTTHDHKRLEDLLLGSVSRSIARHVHVPVLLVPAEESGATDQADVTVRHILVALDGSPLAAEVVPHVRQLAATMGARVGLVSVLEPSGRLLPQDVLAPQAANGPAALAVVPESVVRVERMEAVDGVARSLRSAGLEVGVDVIAGDDVAAAITEHAHQHDADVIAMTTHGRGALGRLMAGSVANAVLRSATIPTLLFQPSRAR